MRITVLASSYPRFEGDGTAPFVRSISEHLAQLGNQVEVVAPFDSQVIPDQQGAIPVHRFRYVWPDSLAIMGHARALEADARLRPLSIVLLPFFFFFELLKLFSVTHSQKSQAIHVHWVIPNGPAAAVVAALQHIPFIVSLHGSDIYISKKNKLFGWVARQVFKRAAAVTACSQELRQAALALGAPQNTLLLPWGADPVLFSPVRTEERPSETDPAVKSKITVFALGRMVYKKGFNVLLEAFTAIIKENPQVKLVLAGDGPLRNNLEEQANQLGLADSVTFTGRIPWNQVPDRLAAADIFVLPSIKDKFGNLDGLPTVLPEAMACEVAVVASDLGGVNLVIQNNTNGLLVQPGDAAALAKAILSLAADPDQRHRLATAARQSVLDQFNWNWVAQQIQRLLDNAAWNHQHKLRLGTVYRDEMVRILSKRPDSGWVLDVGCHDGYWLNTLSVDHKIGVDPEPSHVAPDVAMVRGDGTRLPFPEQTFNWVFAMDVIEHVEDDQAFARSLSRMVGPGGRLFLSTPSESIRLTPPVLTGWISRQWGHTLRLGYSKEKLQSLFEPLLDVKITTWNAPSYRFWYLPVRFLSIISPRLAARFVRRIARADAQKTDGLQGFLILEGVWQAKKGDEG